MKNSETNKMNPFHRQAAMACQIAVLCAEIDAGGFSPFLAYSLDGGGLEFYLDENDRLNVSGIKFGAGNFAPDLVQDTPQLLDGDEDFLCTLKLDFENRGSVNLIKSYGTSGGEIIDEQPREEIWEILQQDDPEFYGETYPILNPPKVNFENPTERKVEEFLEAFSGLYSETALREIFKTYENWLSDELPKSVCCDDLRRQWTEAHPRKIWNEFDGCDRDSVWKSGERVIYDLAALNKNTIAVDTGGCDVAGMTETRVLVMC